MSFPGVNSSTDLNWLITRNHSSFLLKRKGVNHYFSTDPLNPKGLFKPRFQGTTQPRMLSIQENPTGKGVVMVYKTKNKQNRPAKSLARVVMSGNSRRTIRNIKQFVNKKNYRNDLKNVCRKN